MRGAHLAAAPWLLALLLGCGHEVAPAPAPAPAPAAAARMLLRPTPVAPFHLALDGAAPLPSGFSSPATGPDGVRRAFMGACTSIPVRPSCLSWHVLEMELALVSPARLEVSLAGKSLETLQLAPGLATVKIPLPQGLLGEEEHPLDLVLPGGAAVSRLDVVVEGDPRLAPEALTATTPLRAELLVRPDRVLVMERPASWGDAPVELRLRAAGLDASRLLPPAAREWRMDLRAFAYRQTAIEMRLAGESCASDRRLAVPEVWLEPRGEVVPTSIVLFSLDTLRVDELGAGGGARMATPRIDAILRGSRLHADAYSSSHWTLPAHASLFLSVSPDVHGADRGRAPSRSLASLTESLWDAGYQTAGFVNDVGWLAARFGFGRGFDSYVVTRDASAGRAKLVLRYLQRHPKGPLFLFVHFYEAHSDFRETPYESLPLHRDLWAPDRATFPRPGRAASEQLTLANRSGSRYTPSEEHALSQMYVAGLADLDVAVGRMAATLRAAKVWDDAVVVLLSDHGEEIGEHGGYLHDKLHEEVTRSLVAFRLPGGRGALVRGVCSIVDVAPTVLALAGIPVRPVGWEGVDLARGAPGHAYAVSRLGDSMVRSGEQALHRERDGQVSAYDLALDPGEHRPRPYDRERDGLELLGKLAEARARAAKEAPAAESAGVTSPEEAERLRALGYVQ